MSRRFEFDKRAPLEFIAGVAQSSPVLMWGGLRRTEKPIKEIAIAGNLSHQLRRLADQVTERVWIAVPYVGTRDAVERLLGIKWQESDDVKI